MYVESIPVKLEAIISITENRIEYLPKFSGPKYLAITIAINAASNLENTFPKETIEKSFRKVPSLRMS